MSKTKFTWSEVFLSIEGEGPRSGWPTVYVRFTGCNFECRGFNNPDNLDTTSVEVLGFDPSKYKSLEYIPTITRGCDSIYSWDSKFKHLWKEGDEDELAQLVVNTLPHQKWMYSDTHHPMILSLTGGEPTLIGKKLGAFLLHPLIKDVRCLLIETNCSVPLHADFKYALRRWLTQDDYKLNGTSRTLIWSNSPKLSTSGEKRDRAIKPQVALDQLTILQNWSNSNIEQYFKFVCGDSDEQFDEVADVMSEYYTHGVSKKVPIYIMPMACTETQQIEIAANVARKCIDRGYIYTHRIQNSVFGNGVGT